MDNLTLKAQPRTIIGKQVKKLRDKGLLPAILYGKEIKSQPLQIDSHEYQHIFRQSGVSTLVDLEIDDQKPIKVLLHEPQNDPLSDQFVHADIYQVKMSEKIHTEIPLEFIGESAAVVDLEGNLITNRDSLEVECMPDALVSSIKVDLSQLKTFADVIHIKDIKVPDKIEVLNDPEEAVALVTEPRSEEELAEELAPTAEEEEKAAVAELDEAAAPTEEGKEEEATAQSEEPKSE